MAGAVTPGDTFGRLTVIGPARSIDDAGGRHRTAWLCRCLCGREKTVRQESLVGGSTRSCGKHGRGRRVMPSISVCVSPDLHDWLMLGCTERGDLSRRVVAILAAARDAAL